MYSKYKSQIKDIEGDSEVRAANKCYFPSVIILFSLGGDREMTVN